MNKKTVIQLIKAFRLPECFLVVALGFIGFKYAEIQPHILTLVTLFFVISVTMLQNDWRDRIHDLKKGKRLAYEKPSLFLFWLILFWVICLVLIGILFLENAIAAGILALGVLLAAIYSEIRRLPLASVAFVSISVATALLIPLAFGASFKEIMPLFFATILIMFGRETLHDIADKKADGEYKKTIPILINDRFARAISAIALVVGCGLAIFFSIYTIIGSLFIMWGLLGINKEARLIKVRKKVDAGLVLLCLSLIALG